MSATLIIRDETAAGVPVNEFPLEFPSERITVRELLTYQPSSYRINGQPANRALLVTVANSSQFGNGAHERYGGQFLHYSGTPNRES